MTAAELTLHSIIGQEKAKKFLLRALAGNSLAHAYLFRGPAGTGKKRTAHTLAAFCNCLTPTENDACGICSSCRKYQAGSHPDLIVLEPVKGIIRIDQVRELKKTLQFPPLEARYRFVLLPDVHATMRRRETANSLLKSLEEPPPDTVLILTADETGEVLPTIRSRCQVVPFFPLPADELTHTLAAEGGLDPEESAALARTAEGSLGRARLLRDKGLLAQRAVIAETLCTCRPGSPAATAPALALADRAAGLKDDLGELLDLLAFWFRDLILLKNGTPEHRLANPDLAPLLPVARDRWNHGRLLRNLEYIDAARRQLAHNCRPSLVCEVLFFALL